jgi:hypothetical protein
MIRAKRISMFIAPLLLVAPALLSIPASCVQATDIASAAPAVASQPEKAAVGAAPGMRENAVQPLEASRFTGTLIGMQYETWFTPGNFGKWESAEAVPMLGRYSSYDTRVMRRHEAWFEHLGIDWLLIDLSNLLTMKPKWEDHSGPTRELEDTTQLLFKTFAELEAAGKHPPKLVLMLGLDGGDPASGGIQRLNAIIEWIGKNFLAKPQYKNRWLYFHGKPLMTILTLVKPCERLPRYEAGPQALHAPDWTVRWMSTQFQASHADRCGMWSWMDGPIRQTVTYRDNAAEETVVTPASFEVTDLIASGITDPASIPPDLDKGGWLAPTAIGRDHGAPYLESWQVAFESRPKFIQIHQWNEFAGQKAGEGLGPKHDIYLDEYNLELSDDLEPVAMDTSAYRGSGGWGYYYFNLTKALISLYRNETPDITVLALSGPVHPALVKDRQLSLSWKVVGKPPASYTLLLDGRRVAGDIQGEKYLLELGGVPAGRHRVTLVANGARTYFDLTPEKMAEKSATPLPVTSSIAFIYAQGSL